MSKDSVITILEKLKTLFSKIHFKPRRAQTWAHIWYLFFRNILLFLVAGFCAYETIGPINPFFVILPALAIFISWDLTIGVICKLPKFWIDDNYELISEIDAQVLRSGNIMYLSGFGIYFYHYIQPISPTMFVGFSSIYLIFTAIKLGAFWLSIDPDFAESQVEGEASERVQSAFDLVPESLASRWITRKAARPLTYYLYLLYFPPAIVTGMGFLCMLVGCLAALYLRLDILAVCMVLYNLFDRIDGPLARARARVSYFGGWLDWTSDKLADIGFITSLGWVTCNYISMKIGWPWFVATILLATITWTESSLHLITELLLARPKKPLARKWRYQWRATKLKTHVTSDWYRYICAFGLLVSRPNFDFRPDHVLLIALAIWAFAAWGRMFKMLDRDASW
ncbi:MAG: CDP-alcohol phosphatidyltransferase family protein [Candidatus Lindowbacteria bacterium]|nr:CDP-alcohol phosphatidyltransferase family protein [Candidatus Lindowbacteria bacterium]